MTRTTPYLFIHPLLDSQDHWSAYLVETSPDATPQKELLQAFPARVMAQGFDRRHPWLVPAELLAQAESGAPLTQGLPLFNPGQPATATQEAEYRKAGRRVAAQASIELKLPAPGTWDWMLITLAHARTLPPYTLVGHANRTQVVATDVHSQSDRDWALGQSCALTTGEFLLARSAPVNKADTTRCKLLKLLSLIAQDADTAELDEIFREEAKLSYSLLRLVNSAAISPRSPITSFVQAINLLGRRQLERWLQLLVFADPNNGQHPTPLLYKAAYRGRLMEQLVGHLEPVPDVPEPGNCAFMAGCFSLLDILLNMSMPEILQQLPLTPAVRQALARHDGPLGQLLGAIDAIDTRNLGTAARILDTLGISDSDFLDAQIQALHWATRIQTPGDR